jgi:NADH:ubiquinone oxidoreductase subunit H
MKQKASPVVVVIAVVAVIAFCYFMYQRTNPSVQSAYNPKRVGPPGYARRIQDKGSNTSGSKMPE